VTELVTGLLRVWGEPKKGSVAHGVLHTVLAPQPAALIVMLPAGILAYGGSGEAIGGLS